MHYTEIMGNPKRKINALPSPWLQFSFSSFISPSPFLKFAFCSSIEFLFFIHLPSSCFSPHRFLACLSACPSFPHLSACLLASLFYFPAGPVCSSTLSPHSHPAHWLPGSVLPKTFMCSPFQSCVRWKEVCGSRPLLWDKGLMIPSRFFSASLGFPWMPYVYVVMGGFPLPNLFNLLCEATQHY